MKNESTLILRKILSRRFNIHRHLIKPDDIRTLMGYMTIDDMSKLDEDEMKAFIGEGRRFGMFFAPSREVDRDY
jgi:hypothetical protein